MNITISLLGDLCTVSLREFKLKLMLYKNKANKYYVTNVVCAIITLNIGIHGHEG